MFNLCRYRNRTGPFLFLASVLCVSVLGRGVNAFGQTPTAPQLLPYIVTLLAGGAASNPAAGTTCPQSGFKSTDKFGDGCLATEVVLNAPRFVTQDKLGNYFFSDSANAIVRRIDATTGVITVVAGGAASNPTSGAACPSGTGTATTGDGDGCLGTDVKLGKPHGLAFSPSGDLYFADNSFSNIRKVAATNGVISTTGVITNAVGSPLTFGYNVNTYSGTTLTTPVLVSSQSGPITAQTYLNDPSGIAFDQHGNLYIADEGNNAVEVVNFGTADTTIMGLPVPMGTIAKLVGYGSLNTKTANSGECPNYASNATGSRGGCYFGNFMSGSPARSSNVDSVYDVAVDSSGNLYFANEFIVDVGLVNAATGNVSNYAGTENASTAQVGKISATSRGLATSLVIGSDFSVALDQGSNLYVSDTSSGVIWRVDAGSSQMYALAGGATSVCSSATDAVGDGCPGPQTMFSSSGLKFATSNTPGPAGVRIDPFGDLLVTDSMGNLVRKISNGTQFGTINGSKPTQLLEVHYGVNDGPAASNPYSFTSGASNFVLGSQKNCTVNSDNTMDCVLPVQATPSVPGAFSGTLAVVSKSGSNSSFVLGGTFSPIAARSTTTVAIGTTNGCTGTTVAVGSQVTITSASTGVGGTPTGTVTFFNGTAQIGTPQALNSSGQASVTTSFAAAGIPSITAVYSGDPFFNASTSKPASLSVVAPSFSSTLNSQQSSTVAAGQTALFSFTVASTVYTGNISFACSGLPAASSCVFSPAVMAETGCSNSQTVTLSIVTTQPTPVALSSFAALPFGRGPWAAFGMLPGLLLAFVITLRRRKNPPMKYGQIWLAVALLFAASGVSACSSGTQSTPGTPTGTSTVTVTASGGGGNAQPLNVTLIVH
ncbi:MAG: Ig-like domain repeat protein [Edaphobacter sp.]